jgi:hypothetical protein
MRYVAWCLCICAAVFFLPVITSAFDIQLTDKQIKEATDYGSKYKGKEIFNSDIIKSASFGEYPGGEGGLVMSKYVKLAVVCAMAGLRDKSLTPDDIKEITKSPTFNVVIRTFDDSIEDPEDVQITLIQGSNNILPLKNEFGMKYKDNRQSVIGVFQYEKVNPHASTTVEVKTWKSLKKYKINFSKIK